MNHIKGLITLFSVIIISTIVLVIQGVKTIEKDKYYLKIHQKSENSLIIGTSKAAALPIAPLNISNTYANFQNFAFNLGMSPYGPAYFKQIKNRVEHMENKSKKKYFLLCVDPWSMSNTKKSPNDSLSFSENETEITFLPKENFSALQYFVKFYRSSYMNLFLPQKDKNQKETRPDSTYISKHLKSKIEAYRNTNAAKNQFSELRFQYFLKTIDFLKNYGEVILVRLPVAQEMKDLEREYAPNFDSLINKTASEMNLKFIDFYTEKNNYLCPDGNHLFWEDAEKVSQEIAEKHIGTFQK